MRLFFLFLCDPLENWVEGAVSEIGRSEQEYWFLLFSDSAPMMGEGILRRNSFLGSALNRLRRILGAGDDSRKVEDLIRRGLVTIGRHTYGKPRIDAYRGSEARIVIGDFCSISRGVVFVAGGVHPTNWCSTLPFRIKFQMPGAYNDGLPTTRGNIVVGCDVWIGTEAMVLSGVRIGDGAVIAARSVVTRDVPPYAIVAGVPAMVVSSRFEEEIVSKLLEIRWWDWPDEEIREAVPFLSSPEIGEFVARYYRGGVSHTKY